MGVVLFTGCEEPVERGYMEFPVELLLPADEIEAVTQAPNLRVMGDPGHYERFEIPTNLYMFVVFNYTSEEIVVPIIQNLEKEDWEEIKLYNPGDIVLNEHYYSYKNQYNFKPNLTDLTGVVVYAAVSDIPLKLSKEAPTTEDEVLAITFSMDNSDYPEEDYGEGFDIQEHLQNIYSSPYNYKPEGSTYYGTVKNMLTATIPSLRLVLYHVASKVDIMWNVPSDNQDNVKVRRVEVKNLFNGNSFLFKPTENLNSSITDGGDTYSFNNEVGRWWNRREYFYTIPYLSSEGKCSLYVDFTLENTSGSGVPNPKYEVTKEMSMPAVFTPWIRGQFSFSSPVTANTVYPVAP